MEKPEVTLARMEQQLLNLNENVIRFMNDQGKKNKEFFDVRDKILALEAKSNVGWKLICAFGSVTIGVSCGVAWIVTHIKLRMMGL